MQENPPHCEKGLGSCQDGEGATQVKRKGSVTFRKDASPHSERACCVPGALQVLHGVPPLSRPATLEAGVIQPHFTGEKMRLRERSNSPRVTPGEWCHLKVKRVVWPQRLGLTSLLWGPPNPQEPSRRGPAGRRVIKEWTGLLSWNPALYAALDNASPFVQHWGRPPGLGLPHSSPRLSSRAGGNLTWFERLPHLRFFAHVVSSYTSRPAFSTPRDRQFHLRFQARAWGGQQGDSPGNLSEPHSAQRVAVTSPTRPPAAVPGPPGRECSCMTPTRALGKDK